MDVIKYYCSERDKNETEEEMSQICVLLNYYITWLILNERYEAVDDLLTLIEQYLAPDMPEGMRASLYNNRGVHLLMAQRYHESRKCFKQSLDL